MILLKYFKRGDARYISHIDLLRHVSRILRRAGIPVETSQGFNPHARVFFSPPLALGVDSEAEYICIDTAMSADEVLIRWNVAVPDGLRATAAREVDKNPNLQARTVAADYIYPYAYRDVDFSDFEIEYSKKGEVVKEDVSNKIFCAFERDGKLALRLATGEKNLRPDRLINALNAVFKTEACAADILKVAQYVSEDGALRDVDSVFFGK